MALTKYPSSSIFFILNGTFDYETVDETTQWLLKSLQYTAGSEDALDYHLSAGAFREKIKSWDERTSTSPVTNVHLGHAKAYYAITPLKEGSKEEDSKKRHCRIRQTGCKNTQSSEK